MRRRDTLCLLFPSVGMFSRNNNKHNFCASLICTFFFSFFFFMTGGVWRHVPAMHLLTPDRQWMWGHSQGGAVLGLGFLSTCIIRYAAFFGRSLYLFHGRSRWAWDRRAYGSVSACFLNLAICPLVPITFLLPDLRAEQIILIHMAEYCLQCCLQGNLKHRPTYSTHSEVIKLGSGNPRVPQCSARGSVKIKLNVKKCIFRAVIVNIGT